MLPSAVLTRDESRCTDGLEERDVSKHLGSALEIEDLSGHSYGFPTVPFPGTWLEELSLYSLN